MNMGKKLTIFDLRHECTISSMINHEGSDWFIKLKILNECQLGEFFGWCLSDTLTTLKQNGTLFILDIWISGNRINSLRLDSQGQWNIQVNVGWIELNVLVVYEGMVYEGVVNENVVLEGWYLRACYIRSAVSIYHLNT